mmetsp:Transcript_1439/g.4181  ORF Transcript_1439/g.4181 Transcript_1439/m.4181 type:complete len:308 (+) Transcript_1439:209-1132(+)
MSVREGVSTVKVIFGGSGADRTAGMFVDEDVGFRVDIGSAEERELLEALRARLKANPPPAPPSESLLQRCLRGRKFDVEKAARAVSDYQELLKELGLDGDGGVLPGANASEDRLRAHARLGFMNITGGEDLHGRSLIWIRLARHDPKVYSALDVARLIAHSLDGLLSTNARAQTRGVLLMLDMTGASIGNMDFGIPRLVLTSVLPRLPVRVGHVVGVNPLLPFRVVFPIAQALMKPKMKARIRLVQVTSEAAPGALREFFDPAQLPPELGGTFPGHADPPQASNAPAVSRDASGCVPCGSGPANRRG